jgi:hypothetical protein
LASCRNMERSIGALWPAREQVGYSCSVPKSWASITYPTLDFKTIGRTPGQRGHLQIRGVDCGDSDRRRSRLGQHIAIGNFAIRNCLPLVA